LGDPPGLHDSAGAVCVLSRLGSRLAVIEIAKNSSGLPCQYRWHER
jgi:hypothetical protein